VAQRFLREIVALYDSGTTDGGLYYVMSYLSGRSLRERMAKDRSG
jgi:serine/threonine protein kinase